MAKEEELLILSPKLPDTPGWVALNQSEKEELQKLTSSVNLEYRAAGLHTIKECVALARMDSFLEGKPMTMTNWLRNSYNGSERNGRRKLKSYKLMKGSASDEAILYLAEKGLAGLGSVQTGDLVPVLKMLPAPKDKKSFPAWTEKVGEAIRQSHRRRGSGKKDFALSENGALVVGVASVNRVMREAKLATSAEKRGFLKKLGGYVMEKQAITGSVTFERMPIPDGLFPKRGAPVGPRKKKTS